MYFPRQALGKMLGCAFPCSNRDKLTNPLWGRRVSCSEPRDSCIQEAGLLTISRDASLEGHVSLCLENSAQRFRAAGLRGGAADLSACAGTRTISSCALKRAERDCSLFSCSWCCPEGLGKLLCRSSVSWGSSPPLRSGEISQRCHAETAAGA